MGDKLHPRHSSPSRKQTGRSASRSHSRPVTLRVNEASATFEPASSDLVSARENGRWDGRRRDPRMNGADIYVARVTKHGMGCAKPCWRCLEWARWAGVKRIFHWDESQGRFEVMKVNAIQVERYGTHSDVRLFAGLVCPCRRLYSVC